MDTGSASWKYDELETIPDMPNTLDKLLASLKGPTSLIVLKPCCGVRGDLQLWKQMGTETIVEGYDIERLMNRQLRRFTRQVAALFI